MCSACMGPLCFAFMSVFLYVLCMSAFLHAVTVECGPLCSAHMSVFCYILHTSVFLTDLYT